jgi:vacuolar-type H+-ATPase subunit H
MTPSADLALLVSTEVELEERLNQARAQAGATIETAYTEAGARSRDQEAELTRTGERFQAEVEAERDARAREVLAEGERRAARFDAVAEGQVAELAEVVVGRLLRGVGG